MIEVLDKAKIKTTPIFLSPSNELAKEFLIDSLDYVPYLYLAKLNDTQKPPIKGTTLDPKDVIYIKLHNSKFLPEIELYCDDSKGILFNDMYPFDHDTLLCIFVKTSSDNLFPIRMDFRVTEYETIKSDDNRDIFKYLIKGILNVDNLHFTRYESRKGTSFDVIRKIANEMELGFASNVTSSNDEMTWINPSETYLHFINDITKYSFISEESFIWTFIDFQYNINYVNIQMELNEFNREEKGHMMNKQVIKDQAEVEVDLFLTNNKAFKGTSIHINKFNLINQSFKVNLEKSYRMKSTWYDKNVNTVFKQYLKELETDESKLKDSDGQLKQLIDKSSQIYCENINDEYFLGKFDTENNVHKNYAIAKVSNKWNLDNLEKMKMIVTLTQTNFSIKRFQNIKIEIYNPDDVFSSDASGENSPPAGFNINKKLSGYWYVTGINYLYKRSAGVEQEITLMRRDLNLNYGGNQNNNETTANKVLKTI